MSLTLEGAAYLLYGIQKKSSSDNSLDKLLDLLEYDCMEIENYTKNKQDLIAKIIKHPEFPSDIRDTIYEYLNEGNIRAAKRLLQGGIQ
jgi:uncharacterized protein YuzB (UPF0349 family)